MLPENQGASPTQDKIVSDPKNSDDPIVIKKYANRRLYNTDSSSYVTLEDLAEMVKADRDFIVQEAKSGDDITRAVLTQIIFEQEAKGETLLPIGFLRQLIGFYDTNMKDLVPSYLEFSLDSLNGEQENLNKQLMEKWGKNPFEAIQDQVKTNMEAFEKALGSFTPFGTPGSAQPQPTPEPAPKTGDDFDELKSQLSDLQTKLDSLARDRSK